MAAPHHLRVEHLDEPFGITVARPRLSWRLPPGSARQEAYRLRAGSWDSGRVVSPRSLLVPYGGPPLGAGERVEWSVQVWTDLGRSEWAEPASWEMGLPHPGDWVARWIEPPAGAPAGAEGTPVWYLGRSFDLAAEVSSARLYATAHGVYEFFVNGRRAGDMELTPGFTSYPSTLQVQTFDVTALLRPGGENTLTAVLSGGWVTWTNRFRDLGVGLLAQLHLVDPAGAVRRLGTGADWRAGAGAIRSADLRQGQVTDLRVGSDPVGVGAPVVVRDVDLRRLVSSPAPPVRRVQELRPVRITRPAPDRQVIDLGQNINGWIRLARLGPAGTTVTLTHGEAVDTNGDLTIDHLVPPEQRAEPFQEDQTTSAGVPGQVFEPRHVTHGFRYVRVQGHPEDLHPDDVTGVVVHSDLRRTGWFTCGDDRLNRLHEVAVWSLRGNACDIPTDCPTRERAGWTGDWQVFVPAAAYLYDVAGFTTKWLRDLAADQRPDGTVWHCAPNPEPAAFYETFPPGSAGWGDASVIVPWEIYLAYGDRDLLEQQWASMTAWVEYAARQARERRHPSRAEARPVPAEHERYLWDTGFHWGEWLEPGADMSAATVALLNVADHGATATAYLYRSADLLARVAAVLGRDAAAAHYGQLASAARGAWQAEFLRPDGTMTPDTQATYVRALAFDLVPPSLRVAATARLAGLVRAAGTHLGTGFLSTSLLLPALADNGEIGLAYELLLRDTEPSWLTMIARGATTTWEQWDGIDADGVPHASLNHYSKGAVVSFLHRYVTGIQPDPAGPGYRRFRVAPHPGGGLTWAEGRHDSPYGPIESHWWYERDSFRLDVTVPPGTTAEVRLPDGQRHEMPPGRRRFTGKIHDRSVQ
ncbi:family 78 glycoside hydrolase catalytic domain [Phytohabitans kaempferiae]|uniref:alpha-L-rhamnosidase n=1 Tax=Phytohabitans kaempferiae TaxID=1620943 RepID=A0ABV6MAC5_9ACTN